MTNTTVATTTVAELIVMLQAEDPNDIVTVWDPYDDELAYEIFVSKGWDAGEIHISCSNLTESL